MAKIINRVDGILICLAFIIAFCTQSKGQKDISVHFTDCSEQLLYLHSSIFLEPSNQQLLLRADSINYQGLDEVFLKKDSSIWGLPLYDINTQSLDAKKYKISLNYCALVPLIFDGDTFWSSTSYEATNTQATIFAYVVDYAKSTALKHYIISDILQEYQESYYGEIGLKDTVLFDKTGWIIGLEKGVIGYGDKKVFFLTMHSRLLCLCFDDFLVLLVRGNDNNYEINNFSDYVSFSPIGEFFGNGVSFYDASENNATTFSMKNLLDKTETIDACKKALKL